MSEDAYKPTGRPKCLDAFVKDAAFVIDSERQRGLTAEELARKMKRRKREVFNNFHYLNTLDTERFGFSLPARMLEALPAKPRHRDRPIDLVDGREFVYRCDELLRLQLQEQPWPPAKIYRRDPLGSDLVGQINIFEIRRDLFHRGVELAARLLGTAALSLRIQHRTDGFAPGSAHVDERTSGALGPVPACSVHVLDVCARRMQCHRWSFVTSPSGGSMH